MEIDFLLNIPSVKCLMSQKHSCLAIFSILTNTHVIIVSMVTTYLNLSKILKNTSQNPQTPSKLLTFSKPLIFQNPQKYFKQFDYHVSLCLEDCQLRPFRRTNAILFRVRRINHWAEPYYILIFICCALCTDMRLL